MKNLKHIILGVIAFWLVGCNDVLDKEYLEAINPEDIWGSTELAEAYVNNFYGQVMPGWPLGAATSSDEGVTNQQLGDFLRGTATIDTWNNWPYDKIRTINTFMANIDNGSIEEVDKKPLKGQMLFWRAWLYFGMVKGYGGVPLITEPQATDDPEILVKRSKTSECFAQIMKDLDDAIGYLPDTWSGADVGRVDKVAAMAFKGRVALFQASPLFNPSREQSKWQAAYDANKAAVDFAVSKGKGLYDDFKNIWYDELNKEALMVRRFNNPGSTFFVGGIRPIIYSKDAANSDNVALELVNAFPMKDGSAFDPASGYLTLGQNRDDRFYATVAYNGSDMGLADMKVANTYLWTYFIPGGGSTEATHPSPSSFYRQKGQDLNVERSTVYDATVDWIEIRFAEILMNMGEAANEIGKASEALDVLHQIRERANIEAGDANNYGIAASSKEAIREVYFNERFVEFALEGKRWNQIRRLRKYDYLNNIGKRHGLKWTLKEGVEGPSGYDDMSDPDIYNRFEVEVLETDQEQIDIPDSYYFYGIPKTHLERNSNLEQTQGWDNGTFDPLQ